MALSARFVFDDMEGLRSQIVTEAKRSGQRAILHDHIVGAISVDCLRFAAWAACGQPTRPQVCPLVRIDMNRYSQIMDHHSEFEPSIINIARVLIEQVEQDLSSNEHESSPIKEDFHDVRTRADGIVSTPALINRAAGANRQADASGGCGEDIPATAGP